MPPTNSTYTANFAPTVVVTVGSSTNMGGTVTGGGTFVAGSTNQLAAAASNGWVFTGWSDGSKANPRQVVAPTTNSTYTADFAAGTIYVYVANVGDNTIEKYDASGSNLGVFASTGLNWPTFIAIQTVLQSMVSTAANPTNGGSVDGGGVYAIGDTVTLKATAASNWVFSA